MLLCFAILQRLISYLFLKFSGLYTPCFMSAYSIGFLINNVPKSSLRLPVFLVSRFNINYLKYNYKIIKT